MDLGGFCNTSCAQAAFWKSLVHTTVSHRTELQPSGSQRCPLELLQATRHPTSQHFQEVDILTAETKSVNTEKLLKIHGLHLSLYLFQFAIQAGGIEIDPHDNREASRASLVSILSQMPNLVSAIAQLIDHAEADPS